MRLFRRTVPPAPCAAVFACPAGKGPRVAGARLGGGAARRKAGGDLGSVMVRQGVSPESGTGRRPITRCRWPAVPFWWCGCSPAPPSGYTAARHQVHRSFSSANGTALAALWSGLLCGEWSHLFRVTLPYLGLGLSSPAAPPSQERTRHDYDPRTVLLRRFR
jgi:hypothetical protein